MNARGCSSQRFCYWQLIWIIHAFGIIKMAEGEQIHLEYWTLGRTLNSAIRAEERALLTRVQAEYDRTAPMLESTTSQRGSVEKNHLQEYIPTETIIETILSPKVEPQEKRTRPLRCQGFQCLYCLLSNLPLSDRQKFYRDKFALKRHVDRCRLKQFQPDDLIPCPDNLVCGRIILGGKCILNGMPPRSIISGSTPCCERLGTRLR